MNGDQVPSLGHGDASCCDSLASSQTRGQLMEVRGRPIFVFMN
jgi:hypothetical protein